MTGKRAVTIGLLSIIAIGLVGCTISFVKTYKNEETDAYYSFTNLEIDENNTTNYTIEGKIDTISQDFITPLQAYTENPDESDYTTTGTYKIELYTQYQRPYIKIDYKPEIFWQISNGDEDAINLTDWDYFNVEEDTIFNGLNPRSPNIKKIQIYQTQLESSDATSSNYLIIEYQFKITYVDNISSIINAEYSAQDIFTAENGIEGNSITKALIETIEVEKNINTFTNTAYDTIKPTTNTDYTLTDFSYDRNRIQAGNPVTYILSTSLNTDKPIYTTETGTNETKAFSIKANATITTIPYLYQNISSQQINGYRTTIQIILNEVKNLTDNINLGQQSNPNNLTLSFYTPTIPLNTDITITAINPQNITYNVNVDESQAVLYVQRSINMPLDNTIVNAICIPNQTITISSINPRRFIESMIEYGQNQYDYGIIAGSQNAGTEFIDIRGMMLQILGMPFTFISKAFDVTLWEGTQYAFNFANFFKGLIAILTILFIIRLFTSGLSAIGTAQSNRENTKLTKSQTELNKAKAKQIESKTK